MARSIGLSSALALAAVAGGVCGAVSAQDVSLSVLGRYETGIFGEGGSEIVAHDPASQRLFITNGATDRLDVVDISTPSSPTLAFSIDLSAIGSGANSVAVHDGIVAAAIEANVKTDPGSVAFFDADGTLLATVQVGALPDMITFTPDGAYVLVANEGEPNDDYTIDPEGSVSVIAIPEDITTITQDDVQTASFDRFNGAELDPSIRIFGPGATVAQDLEPEYIAVSSDSTTAWVSCQENNAIAVIDIAGATVTELRGLGFKEHALGGVSVTPAFIEELPALGTTDAGQEILLGGFSGLYFDGVNPDNGRYVFLTHPDRGPNADPVDVDGDGVAERPFPLPDFQTRIVVIELDPATLDASIVDQIMLTREDGVTPITGLPNVADSTVSEDGPEPGFAYADEEPIGVFGDTLPYDPYGGDMEGIVRSEDGTIWIVDEYRPALYHFDVDGVLIDRYVPEGANAFGETVGTEAFPAVYAQRRANRGFEAVAYQDGKVYCFIQSPIDNPDTANDQSSKDSLVTRILEFDITSETVTGDFAYVIDGEGSDKIGDAVSFRPGEFLVIERDSSVGVDSKKNIYHVSLAGATNLLDLGDEIVGPGGSLELTAPDQLADIGVTPVAKALYANIAAAGYDFSDKAEGLALIEPGLLAVINDNDFQLAGGIDVKTGLVDFLEDPQPVAIALVAFSGNGMDASNQDGEIRIVNWPTLGMYQPDSIGAYEVGGETYIVTANEGDARDYDGFSEEQRVHDLALDPLYFPTADSLQLDGNLGRLLTTSANGDLDGDGDVDAIFSYGARSFTIRNAAGGIVWDSGDALEQITAAAYPDDFNSTDDENGSFDNRSDDKGPEPEGLAIGTIGDRTYAFVGLERIGGIVVYDVTDPASPTFVQYVNTRDFAGDPEQGTAGDLAPEGLAFIDAEDSPTGKPLLAVGYEVSGTTVLFNVLTGCPADFNGDGAANILDWVDFQGTWIAGDAIADCDADGQLTRMDFVCFQKAFQAGCP